MERIDYKRYTWFEPMSRLNKEEKRFIADNNLPPDKIEYHFGRKCEYWRLSTLNEKIANGMPPEPFNYYREQLERINPKGEYAPTIQIKDGGSDARTNNLNLNDESASELVRWLKMHFNITAN